MKKLFTFLFLSLTFYVSSQVPSGYYSSAEGKNTGSLRTALQAIISNGTIDVGYSGLWAAYGVIDRNSSGKIWDMYSNCSFTFGSQQCGNYSAECDCYNREHTSPQSWFNSAAPMVSDLFNVLPTDGKVNGERSNYPYGEVGTPTYTSGNGSKLGPSSFPDYSGTVFEPIDEYKGDFARSYFYMATRYAGLCESWTAGAEVMYSTANLGLTTYAMDLFLKWSREDPVSAKEIMRNNAVYGIQNNRNPFIDNPGLEEYIWGNKKTEVFSASGATIPYLGSPSNGSTVDLGKVSFQTTDTISVLVKGANLTGDLTVALNGTDAALFSVSSLSISQANATLGYHLVISCQAQALGVKTAQLTVSGGGITSTTLNLTANVVDGFLAQKAGNITDNSFTANWTSSANATGYALNVYYLAGDANATPRTLIESDFTTGLPTGWTATGYTESTSIASAIRMSSGSNFGKITTPVVDLSNTATVLTVRAKQYSNDNGAKLMALVNADTVATWVTAVANQDFTVNIPTKTSTSTISLYTYAGSGKRVYVDYVKLATQGVALTPVSLSGYPKSVGNVLSYQVNDLQNDSTYFYTVTPEGNTTSMSDVIQVHTLKMSSGVDEHSGQSIFWSVTHSGIRVRNLPGNSVVSVMDLMGRTIQSFNNSSSDMRINLSQKGIYLLQVKQSRGLNTYKIRF